MVASIALQLVCLAGGVAAMEDEYHHTQLLQTKLSVDDISHSKKQTVTDMLEKHAFQSVFFKSKGKNLGGPGGRSCVESPDCVEMCVMHYGEDAAEAAAECIDGLNGDEDALRDLGDAFKKGMNAGMNFAIKKLDECVGEVDIVGQQCGMDEPTLFSCVMCAHEGMCLPEECENLIPCINGWQDAFGLPLIEADTADDDTATGTDDDTATGTDDDTATGTDDDTATGTDDKGKDKDTGALIQKKKGDDSTQSTPDSSFGSSSSTDAQIAWVCENIYPDASLEACMAAAVGAAAVCESPETQAACMAEPVDPAECFIEAFFAAMSAELGDDVITARCKEVLGDNVNVELCYEMGGECDECALPITQECEDCVSAACAERDDQCLEDDALILAQKHLKKKQRPTRSMKATFAWTRAKAAMGKIIMSIKK